MNRGLGLARHALRHYSTCECFEGQLIGNIRVERYLELTGHR
jgi:hypothetical protein